MSNEAVERLRFTNEYSTVMEIVTRYGGEQVVAGPPMDRMVNELTEAMLAALDATVERIRAALIVLAERYAAEHDLKPYAAAKEALAILDAEAAKA